MKLDLKRKSLVTTQERKNANEGRFNKVFAPDTPSVRDDAIRDLIKRYPIDPMKDEERMDS